MSGISNEQLLKEGKTTKEWLTFGRPEMVKQLIEEQNGVCPVCHEDGLADMAVELLDLIRTPDHPYSGKDFRDKSICSVAHPTHQQEKYHGNVPFFSQLLSLVQTRTEVQEMRKRLDNRNLAIQRGMDDPFVEPVQVRAMRPRYVEDEAHLTAGIDELMKNDAHPIAVAAVQVPGVGRTTIARILAEINIYKAEHRSSLHRFAGYAPGYDRMAKGDLDEEGRRKKGAKRPYNAGLRVACHVQAKSLIRHGIGHVKKMEWPDLDAEERAATWKALSWTSKYRIGRRHGSGLYAPMDYLGRRDKTADETQWKSEDHRHSDGIRIMMKMFLSHLWEEWRKIEGLPTPLPYPIAVLGHPPSGYISPQDRGWPESILP